MAAGVGEIAQQVLQSQVAGLPHCHVPPIRSISTRRFGWVWLLTPLAWTLAWPALSLLWLNRYDHGESAFIHALYERKHVVMERKGPPQVADGSGGRLVVVGGSATLTGIDAALMEAKLRRPTVNYGVHAGLRLDYLLYRAKQELRAGDTVLFCPEYELWRDSPEVLDNFDWPYPITYDKRYLLSIGAGRFLRAVYSVPLDDYWRSASGWRRRLRGDHHHTRPIYDTSTLSPNGDLGAELPRGGIGRVGTVSLAEVRGTPSGNLVADFATWAKSKGIRLLFCFPNMASPDGPPGDAERAGFDSLTAFLRDCGFTVVDRPEDAWYPRDWFTDTQYHPDAACRRVRTESLISRLRPHLGVSADGATDDVLVAHDDPALAELESRGWRTVEVTRTTASFADWAKPYDRHLFLVAGVSEGGLPPALGQALPTATPVVAAVGTGPWSYVRTVVTSAKASLRTDLRSLTGRAVPQLSLNLRPAPPGTGRPFEILVNRRDRIPRDSPTGLAVVVIDPELGVVLDAASFPADGGPAVTRRVHRLAAPPTSP